MTGSAAYQRIKADVLAIVAKVAKGRLVTHGAVGRHLGVDARHIVNVMAMLDAGERERVPWWRVVADGGAIGRHALRTAQIRLLQDDGVPVAPAGIAQELRERAVTDLTNMPPALVKAAAAPAGAPSRSRGMRSHPATMLK